MGSWGEGVLENDAALDWLGDLEDQPMLETVTIALSTAGGVAREDEEALVAAELVAAALGRSSEERLRTLAASLPGLSDHAGLAAQVVDRVAQDSDLTDLWTEDGPNPEWERVLADLRSRLD
jgi:Domain of unknown function (DUF4259)